MTNVGGIVASAAPSPTDPVAAAKDAGLHKVSNQLEGVFVQEMYKAMRSTVPTGGVVDGGSGEEMFNSLLDEHVAADTPGKWKHGLSESIFRQLKDAVHAQRSALPPESTAVMSDGVDR